MYRGPSRSPCIGIIYTHPSRVGGIQALFSPTFKSILQWYNSCLLIGTRAAKCFVKDSPTILEALMQVILSYNAISFKHGARLTILCKIANQGLKCKQVGSCL